MSRIAIRVEDLSKVYRIGLKEERAETFFGSLVNFAKAPLENYRRLRSLSRFSECELDAAEDVIWALRDVSFEVNEGEVLGVIGANGAGKSTLLKILAGITEPTSGRAELHGRVASLLEVGTGFHPDLTGRENIYLNGTLLGMRKAEIDAKLDEIIDFSGVEKFIDTPVKRYSSGMKVRLAFAVAAHLDPEILLIDEVLAVGDAAFQKKCLGKMEEVAKGGRTVLFVSHNMVAVRALCPQVVWIADGRIMGQGPSGSIVTSYLGEEAGDAKASEREWPDVASAPGTETAKLHRISVRPDASQENDVITMQTPVRIELDYWNLAPSIPLHAVLHVCDDHGVIAFSTSAGFDPDPVLHRQPPAGLLRGVCHIPAGLLNSGVYKVNVLLVREELKAPYRINNVVRFHVVDTNERKYEWYGREPGVVHPSLRWETFLLETGLS